MAITLVIEDGTGLATANVYDSTADCATWLSDRGKTGFSTATASDQTRHLLEATEVHERHWAPWVVGVPISGDDQAMLWPQAGAVDRRGRRFESDERPVRYREGIFVTAEDLVSAGSAGLSLVDDNVEAEKSARGSVEYRSPQTLSARYPAAFQRAGECFPAAIRSARA